MAIKIRLVFCYDSSNYKSVHVDLSTTKAEYIVGTRDNFSKFGFESKRICSTL